MKQNALPDAAYLREVLDYRDGALYGQMRPCGHFTTLRACRIWNAKFSGKCMGRKMPLAPYRQLMVDGVRYLEHRLVAALHGLDLSATIDHIDGNGLNNRIENLRAATQSQNTRNNGGWRSKPYRVGVYKQKLTGKWTAALRVDGRARHLGTFDSEAAAVAARKAAEQREYGEFAPSLSRGGCCAV